MMSMVRNAMVSAMVLLAISTEPANACDTIYLYETASEQIANVDVIFRGRALGTAPGPYDRVITTFKVREFLKLPERWPRPPAILEVQHGTTIGNCGVVFKSGEEALILAIFSNDGSLMWMLDDVAPRLPEAAYREALGIPLR